MRIKTSRTYRQLAFTLIELIMVVVILGILSAFALPKFSDFSDNAEKFSLEEAQVSVKSASAIAHAQYLASGNNPSEIKIEDDIIVMVLGYPSANDKLGVDKGNICTAAGLETSDYACESVGTGNHNDPHIMTIKLHGKNCSFTYTEPDSDKDPATPIISELSGC